MDLGRIVKWLVLLAIVFFAWKYAMPWVKERTGRGGAATVQSDGGCVSAAERASENWGNGLRQFINPPYDLQAWSGFQRDVEAEIAGAESQCSCSAKSCQATRDAMRDLRSLVAEMGTALRNGSSPPSDAVQRQEAIDNRIANAQHHNRPLPRHPKACTLLLRRCNGQVQAPAAKSSEENQLVKNLSRVVLVVSLLCIGLAASADEYTFKVTNNTDTLIKKILVSEDGEEFGFFDIGKGIKPGQTAELVWDSSTNGESCDQYFKAVFANGEESEAAQFNFCDSEVALEFE